MRRVGVLLLAVFLVNLPFVHQTWTDRQVDRSGRDVEAKVLDTQQAGDSFLVDYRLPRSIDREGTRFSARIDQASFERAEETGALLVRVVPGKPSANRPAGEVSNHLFAIVAIIGDLVLLLVGIGWYRRWRTRLRYVVASIDGDEATLDTRDGPLTVMGPPGWTERLSIGQGVAGGLHLAAEHEVLPGGAAGGGMAGLEQVRGSSYVVRGRVLDTRAGRVVLDLGDQTRLRVETGQHRIRADIRDPTEVRGTLCFTPTRL